MCTNDINNQLSFENIFSNFENLVSICSKVHPYIQAFIFAILPRRKNHADTDDFIRSVNGHLVKFMSRPLNYWFLKAYTLFMFEGRVRCK